MRFLTGLRCVHRAAERLNLTGTGEPRIPARRHRWEAAPKVRFAQDSLLEGDGFELPVPREMTTIFEPSCFWYVCGDDLKPAVVTVFPELADTHIVLVLGQNRQQSLALAGDLREVGHHRPVGALAQPAHEHRVLFVGEIPRQE